jgi:hypothetical protein
LAELLWCELLAIPVLEIVGRLAIGAMSVLEPLIGRVVDLDGRRKGRKGVNSVGESFRSGERGRESLEPRKKRLVVEAGTVSVRKK